MHAATSIREQDAQSRGLASTIERIERRVALGEQRAQRALESIALVLERTASDEPPSNRTGEGGAPGPSLSSPAGPRGRGTIRLRSTRRGGAGAATAKLRRRPTLPGSASIEALGPAEKKSPHHSSRGTAAVAEIAARRRQLDAGSDHNRNARGRIWR